LEHVVWKVIDGKGILLNLESGAYFEVNPVGLSIWQRCDGKTPFERLAQSVAAEFHGKPTRVRKDVTSFVSGLKRRKLLEVCETAKASATCP
jgi:hypothetical protein